MNETEKNDGTSEIQFKQHFGEYNLILKNTTCNEVSTVSFQLTDSKQANLMNLELSGAHFEFLMNSLKKFATILKETDPETPSSRPRQTRTEFTDFF